MKKKQNKFMGKNNRNYKDGRTLKKYYCKNCRKKISITAGAYGSGMCRHHSSNNKLNSNYEGGRIRLKSGYILILSPKHPYKQKSNYVFEHRLIMEAYMNKISYKKWVKYGYSGKYPKDVKFLILRNRKNGQEVHHLNEIKYDNRINNFSLETKHSHDKFSIKHEQAKRIIKLENQRNIAIKMYANLLVKVIKNKKLGRNDEQKK